jgi:glycosyltransferase involved in cell wall biosynthesis
MRRIIGPSEVGHDEELRALAATLNLHRVSIDGPVYGARKEAIMRAADLFVLPSLNEKFAITVEGCGWWVGRA